MPKKIDPAVRERVVRRVLERRGEFTSLTAAAAAVAKQERLGTETARRWALQAEVDAGTRSGTSSEEHAEIKRLKTKHNKKVYAVVDILTAATTFFAGELDPRTR